MALSLVDVMREARSIPVYNGTSEYSLSNYIRDVEMVVGLTDENFENVVKSILANKIQGKALQVIDTLDNPSFSQILSKVREEFGVKSSLRNEAINVSANHIEELHKKLSNILNKMNMKYNLEGRVDPLYNPANNNKLVFDVYLNFLPLYIKTLLLQKGIDSIDDAFTYYFENGIMKDIVLNNKNKVVAQSSTNNDTFRYNYRNNFRNYQNDNNQPDFRGAGQPKFRNSNLLNSNLSGKSGHSQQNNFTSNAFRINRSPRYTVPYNNGHNSRNTSVVQNNNSGNFRNFSNGYNRNSDGRNSNNHRAANSNLNDQNGESMDIGNIEVSENFMSYEKGYQLPIVELNIDGIKMNCLVDSGSATTIGDYSAFENLGIRKKLNKPLALKTLTGLSQVNEEVLVNYPFEFNMQGELMSIKLVHFKNKSFDCIIGFNVLNSLGVLIDFSKHILIIQNQKIPFLNSMTTNVDTTHNQENEEIFNSNKILDVCYIEKNELNIDQLISDELNEEERNFIRIFLNKNKSIFYQENQVLSATNCIKHQIITTAHRPVYTKNYKYPVHLENEINSQVQKMLEDGIIRHSNSPYNSSLWVVPKKLDNSGKKKWRIVVDYRKLNQVTIDDKFPSPNIESLFEKLRRANYFSTIDLAKGFHQILMDENDSEKTAFSSPQGHFEFLRMPFGLKNAPATFQRMMNTILCQHINKNYVIYMDDILVFSTSLTEHLESLDKIFKCLSKNKLKIQFDKCKFLSKQTTFLGHVVTPEGIYPSSDKIMAIKSVKLPTTIKEVRAFLGLTGYYRKFIKNYSFIAIPINKYLKKGSKIDCNNAEFIEAFNKLKSILISPPLLIFPNLNKKFVVTIDASNFAIGAVLSQGFKPVCYASRTLNGHEKNYHTLEKEMLAIVWAIKNFRPYLYGRQFTVQTDHQPLKWLFSLKEPNSRVARWKLLLNEYEFDIEYIKGKNNNVADFLSRKVDENPQANDQKEDFNIKQLFENSLASIEENPLQKFYVSKAIVNKYLNQIRVVKELQTNFEMLHSKYKIVYLEKKNLNEHTYINDLLRKNFSKGTVGIFCELSDSIYEELRKKLETLFNDNDNIKFVRCEKMAKDIETKLKVLNIIENTHITGNHRGIIENYEQIKI